MMKANKLFLLQLFFITILAWSMPWLAFSKNKGITEDECAHLQGAEIIWHLSEHRWLCCIPKNKDEYETCIPITDMEPLPKTSLKPFPPKSTKTIEEPPEEQ
jgi:hypothetical protein